MENLYQRYKNEVKSKVWQDLLSLETKELAKHKDDIQLILDFFVKGMKHNIEVLSFYLKDSNYVFTKTKENGVGLITRDPEKEPTYSFTSSSSSMNNMNDLQYLTKDYGNIPLIFSEVYKEIEYINFEGYFPEWRDRNYLNPIPLLDPIVFMSLEMVSLMFEINDKSTLVENDQYYLGFSPTAYTKENTSDDGMYGVFLHKENRMDSKMANYKRDLWFSDYLRNCFDWGGFPGLAYVNNIPNNDSNLELIRNIRKEMIMI